MNMKITSSFVSLVSYKSNNVMKISGHYLIEYIHNLGQWKLWTEINH